MIVRTPRLKVRLQHEIAYCEVLSAVVELNCSVSNSRGRSSAHSMRFFKALDFQSLVMQYSTAHKPCQPGANHSNTWCWMSNRSVNYFFVGCDILRPSHTYQTVGVSERGSSRRLLLKVFHLSPSAAPEDSGQGLSIIDNHCKQIANGRKVLSCMVWASMTLPPAVGRAASRAGGGNDGRLEAQVECTARGGVDTHMRHEASQDHVFYPQRPKLGLQRCFNKRIRKMLDDHVFATLRSDFGGNCPPISAVTSYGEPGPASC